MSHCQLINCSTYFDVFLGIIPGNEVNVVLPLLMYRKGQRQVHEWVKCDGDLKE